MEFNGINSIDNLIKKSDEFTQNPGSGGSGQTAMNNIGIDSDNLESYQYKDVTEPEIAKKEPNHSDEPEYAESKSNQAAEKGTDKFAQEDIELLNGTVVPKDELLRWYYLIRANTTIIQKILDEEGY